jgi:pyridoxal phosphate enzyme (YggS family)
MNATTQKGNDTLIQRIESVRTRITAACARAGRSPDEVQLIAVTKNVPVDRVQAAVEAGLTDFGENRIQEARDKIPAVGGGRWHLVGHLQRNKARAAVEIFATVHSLDSARLARRLEHVRDGRPLDVLIQVNLTDAPDQDGIRPDGVDALADTVDGETGMSLRGLMTIGPLGGAETQLRALFRTLRELRDGLRSRLPRQPLTELSMGMSDDFEIAIAEGATMVRVGRAIFGDRLAGGPTDRPAPL